MRNRFSKWSRQSSKMAYLLASCGLLYACQDPFTLDDEKPAWLNSSIYQSLQDGVEHTLDDGSKKTLTFNTYLRLLADPDVNPANVRPLSDVLGRTGSKTVFVADDEAWEKFFANNAKLPEINPWHTATSYENLTLAQKKLLIHTSMLNNAIVMENLASSTGSNNSRPVRGEYMRRYTDVELTDTISFEKPENLPYSYNLNEKDYWARFRGETEPGEEGGSTSEGGLYLAKDGTLPMMLHFTSEHMAKNSVNDDDFAKFMGRERMTSDVHIYDALLLEKDVVCENGYVNVTEKPLVPLANMAEVIRLNGRTNIFSHMLDRFSAPFYSSSITQVYKNIMKQRGMEWSDQDSIFVKRYFSDNSAGHRALNYEPGPDNTTLPYQPYINISDIGPSLKFDPGWNEFRDEMDVEKDMAAMFVPNDSSMWEFYTKGGGRQLIETYANVDNIDNLIALRPTNDVPFTQDMLNTLYREIDQVPLGTVYDLLSLIMMRSFVGSVPSKMTKLRDDAQEQLFYADDIEKIDTCLLACNGAVYIMNDIYAPANYTSVTSPAYISTTNRIMKWAIYNGSTQGETDIMGLNYYAYLKAMQSEFTFFLPSDEALQYYYDPISFKSKTGTRMIKFKKIIKWPYVEGKGYNYDATTGTTTGRAIQGGNGDLADSDIPKYFKDILESHTIVHDGTNPIHGEDEYFLAKNGTAVKVARDENGTVTHVWGGFQVENERQGIKNPELKGIDTCHVVRAFESLKNGQTYILDAPMIPTYRSVYSILTDNEGFTTKTEDEWYATDPFAKFYDLCMTNEDLIVKCGLVDMKMNDKEKNSAMKKFRIFTSDNGLDMNVQFFNNYRYTLFVPNNEAIDAAIANGLPTWEDILADYESHRKVVKEWSDEVGDSIDVVTEELNDSIDSLRIQTKILYLTNFIRYHFLDNSVFADKSVLPEEEWVTSSYDRDLGLFCKVHVERIKEGGETILRVCDDTRDASGNLNHKWFPVTGEKNLLARDIQCNLDPTRPTMKGVTLESSSAAVIHSISGVLNHTEPGSDGRYDNAWATPGSCKRYLERYAIKQ